MRSVGVLGRKAILDRIALVSNCRETWPRIGCQRWQPCKAAHLIVKYLIMSYDKERVQLYLDDLDRLREWHAAPALGKRDFRDMAVVLYRWLFDRTPMLQAVFDEAGHTLLLPCHSDGTRAYHDTTIAVKPDFFFAGGAGAKPRLGVSWKPLSEFALDLLFYIDSKPITNEAFVKFVRNKLGGGHFDAAERKQWQIDLHETTENLTLLGQHPFNVGMKDIIAKVLSALDDRSEKI